MLERIQAVDSYTEKSPSGTGLKTLLRGKLPGIGHHKKFEEIELGVFDSGRYFCVTGQAIYDTSRKIEQRQEQLDELVRRYWPKDFQPADEPKQRPQHLNDLTEREIIDKALSANDGGKMRRLWEGDIGGYTSPSEADEALCCKLAFWTGRDPALIDSLFRQSGLMRDKWDREDYRQRTIERAIGLTCETYDPQRQGVEPQAGDKPEPAPTENPWSKAVIDFATLRQIELPERRTFLFPWLTEQSITLVYSWRGTGKSFFTLGVIKAVTKGEPFGPWEAVEPVPCLYLDGEMPAGMLQERAEEMGIGGPGTKASARLISMNYALDLGLPRKNLLDAEWRGHLLEILVSGGYKLFFIDNISSLTPGIEENDKQAWDVLNQWLLELRFRGISTVPLHHAGKSGAQRGTSGREDNVDTSILLKRPTDYQITDGCRFICSFEKDRCTDGRQLLVDYEFQYRDGLWTVANAKTKGRDQVLKLLDKGKTQKEVAEELQLTKGRVSQIRREAINNHWLTEGNKLTQSGFTALLGAKPG